MFCNWNDRCWKLELYLEAFFVFQFEAKTRFGCTYVHTLMACQQLTLKTVSWLATTKAQVIVMLYIILSICVSHNKQQFCRTKSFSVVSASKFQFSKLDWLFIVFALRVLHVSDGMSVSFSCTWSSNQNDFHRCLQEVKHIGSSHNRSALPFTGFGPKVVTNQYNNPAGLYSSDNIKDFNSAVEEVKTMATASEANSQ